MQAMPVASIRLAVSALVLAASSLTGCVATGTPKLLFVGNEQFEVKTDYWPDPTQRSPTASEPVQVPISQGLSPMTAATVGVVATGLVNLLNSIPDSDHFEFSQRVGETTAGFDLGKEIVQEVHRAAGGTIPASSIALGDRTTPPSGPGVPETIHVAVQVRHGLWKLQNPIYTPKVTANVLYYDSSGQLALQQVVTFYGAEPSSATAGFSPVVDWWSDKQRYREMLRHASKAIGRQVVWLVRHDPIQRDASLRDRALRAARETTWLDTSSAACAFDPQETVKYRAQRRSKEIAIAALCEGNPLLQVEPAASGLVWVL